MIPAPAHAHPTPSPPALPAVSVVSVVSSVPALPTLRQIFEAELGFVWNSLRRFGVPDADLEDVAHEVFVVVHRHLAELDPTRPIRPWLFAIAFRCSSDYRRRAYRRHETLSRGRAGSDETLDQPFDTEDPSPGVEQRMIAHEEKDLARRALARVPEDRRAVVVLHDFEGVAMHQVAEAFGIPLKTAYSRLRVGRDELLAAARRMRQELR
jgi:RNA polymerase sigma-70 factor (ECF subfamily)